MSEPKRVNVGSRVFNLEIDSVLCLCENIDTPRSLCVYLLLKSEEFKQYLDLKCDANNYRSHSAFADDYLVTSIMQKNPRLPTLIDKKAVAIEGFVNAEARCAKTNSRLDAYLYEGVKPSDDICRAITLATEIISGILGPLRSADLHYAESKFRFGPGSTTSLSGVVTQGSKYKHRILDVTPRLASFRTWCFPPLWGRSGADIRTTCSSKLTTVPKNAKTDRVICIEPDLNIFVQLGIGALLREKLLHSGLDLRTQSPNQVAASQCHLTGNMTMDLSAASDSISRSLIWLLLPDRWAHLLWLARVDKTRSGSETIELAKWSSMGNGYTFELESLLFWGIARACSRMLSLDESQVLAYGDDLIFHRDAYDLVLRTLNFLGFKVNQEKTFSEGLFFESCGTDWFNGHNVRPFYLRSTHHDLETTCYIYANQARRWSCRRNGGYSCDIRLLPFWIRCFTTVPKGRRYRIPDGVGDVGFITDFDQATPSRERCGPWRYRYRRIVSSKRLISSVGSYLAWLNGNRSEFSHGSESLRGRFDAASEDRKSVV